MISEDDIKNLVSIRDELESGEIDDPEGYLEWLVADGVKVISGFLIMYNALAELKDNAYLSSDANSAHAERALDEVVL